SSPRVRSISRMTAGAMQIDYRAKDAQHWDELEAIVAAQGLTVRDIVRYFPAYFRRRELPRFLNHYDLFKKVLDLPGSIVEVGVYRGASFFTWAKLLETFCPGDRSRLVYGFDHFEGLAQFADADGALDPDAQDRSLGSKYLHAH